MDHEETLDSAEHLVELLHTAGHLTRNSSVMTEDVCAVHGEISPQEHTKENDSGNAGHQAAKQ